MGCFLSCMQTGCARAQDLAMSKHFSGTWASWTWGRQAFGTFREMRAWGHTTESSSGREVSLFHGILGQKSKAVKEQILVPCRVGGHFTGISPSNSLSMPSLSFMLPGAHAGPQAPWQGSRELALGRNVELGIFLRLSPDC